MEAEKLTTKSRDAVSAALRSALLAGNPNAEPEHLLSALLSVPENTVGPLLSAVGADPAAINAKAQEAIAKLPSAKGNSVTQPGLSGSLARVLADKPVCLMRAHGSVATGPSLKHAVFRAVYTEVNAKLQIQATIISNGGSIAALSKDEGRIADAVNVANVSRPWDMWMRRITN